MDPIEAPTLGDLSEISGGFGIKNGDGSGDRQEDNDRNRQWRETRK